MYYYNTYKQTYIILIMRDDNTRGNKEFVCLATARHNNTIKNIVYTNKNIIKPLFFIGAVLPDFKISWVVLLCYVVVKYPISLKVLLSNKIKESITTIKLNLMRRGYM